LLAYISNIDENKIHTHTHARARARARI